jgi:GT2 family glycosyltransferase
VWRKEVFEIVGDFDEDLAHYLEDVDLSLRAQLEGIRCYYEPGAVVQHWGGKASGGQNGTLQVRQVSRNLLGILLKNFPRSILTQNALRIGGGLVALQAYHALMGRGLTAAEGLLEGVKLSGQMMAKRKRVLGYQKVPDDRISELMRESEGWLKETASHLPRHAQVRLRLMGMA